MDFFKEYEVYDLSQTVSHDTPAFPIGLQDVRIEHDVRRAKYSANADKILMSCHAGTHLDGPWHFCPRHQAQTINEISLGGGRLVGEGVIVDISEMVGDYDIYRKKEILEADVEVKQGDIMLIHTGYHKFQGDQREADEISYFFKHPGPNQDFADWCLEMKFNWLGIDGGSQDHPLNTGLQSRLPMEDEAFCNKHGVDAVTDIFPRSNWQLMHSSLFPSGIIHVENLGGEISKILNKRCVIGCFPLKLEAESAPCRVVAFVKNGQ